MVGALLYMMVGLSGKILFRCLSFLRMCQYLRISFSTSLCWVLKSCISATDYKMDQVFKWQIKIVAPQPASTYSTPEKEVKIQDPTSNRPINHMGGGNQGAFGPKTRSITY